MEEILKEFDEKFVRGAGTVVSEEAAPIRKFLQETITKVRQDERERIDKLLAYVEHDDRCIRAQFSAGEPTEDGGYRQKFAGKWYVSRPIDETPKCDCGLAELLETTP